MEHKQADDTTEHQPDDTTEHQQPDNRRGQPQQEDDQSQPFGATNGEDDVTIVDASSDQDDKLQRLEQVYKTGVDVRIDLT